MNEQWKQDLREKMVGYQYPAPEVSWDELDRALAAGVVRKARQVWLRRLAAAAVVLLVAGVGFWALLRDEAGSLGDRSQGDRHDVTSQTSHACLSPCDPILAKSTQELLKSDIPAPEPTTVVTASTVASDTVDTAETTDQEKPRAVEKEAKSADHPHPVIYPSDLRQQKHLDNRLTAKVYMSSTMTNSQTGSPSMQGGYFSTDNPKDSAQTINIDQHVHHRQPVRFGLSLRYRLDDRWSIESGLSYTRLSSDITTTVNDVTTVTEQRLNYIGLPLNISYDLWKGHQFGLYVTAGGTIEKCINASLWQFSLSGAAGAEYKLSNSFSLYAEPGLGYYFKDGSSTPTIYKDHPLNFNLSFGLRFNL